MQVLIVGAGPTGLTTAVEMKRQGIDVEVIDKRGSSSGFSRAVGILPKSLEILEPSGVTERLLDEGIKYEELCVYRTNTQMARIPLTVKSPKHGFDFILGLAQDRTELILANELDKLGTVVAYSTELADFKQKADKVFTSFADGAIREFDYLVGADGIGSTTRTILKMDYSGFDLPETWSIADVDADDWIHPNAFTVCQLPKGKIAVVAPLEPRRYRVISNTEHALKTLPLELKTTTIRREGTFKISIRQVETYSNGRVFLAGDAAHCHSPVGGRGMNLGIADATEFASRMSSGTLEGYSASRHQEGAGIISGSERVRKILTSSSPITRSLVCAGMITVNHIPMLHRQLANQILYG